MASVSRPPPIVSVLMPNHNGGRWLAEAVESILCQTLADFEFLIVDDGSTDGSAQILDAFAARDARVRVIRQAHQGLCAALNRGLAEAKAPLVARLDADDLAAPTRLERQVVYLGANPDVGLVGSWATQIDAKGRQKGHRTPQTCPIALKADLPRTNPFIHSSIMARTALLRGLGGYREAFQAAEDYDLWLRIAEVAAIANLPETLVSYRMHGAGVSDRASLRQAFSTRLARGSAMARREHGADPADGLAHPPNWAAPPAAGAFYADDVPLFRWLDQANAHAAPGADLGCEALMDALPRLNKAERRLVARSLIAQVRSGDRRRARAARSLLFRLVRERPSFVLSAVWSLKPKGLTPRRWFVRPSSV